MAASDPYRQTGGREDQPPEGRGGGAADAAVPGWGGFQVPASGAGFPGVPTAGRPGTAQGGPQRQSGATGHDRASGGGGAATGGPQQDGPDESELTSAALSYSPPWLISAAFHMLLLIVLGLVAMSMEGQDQIDLDLTPTYADELGDQLDFDSPLAIGPSESIEEPALSLSELIEVEDPLAAPGELPIYPDGVFASSSVEAPAIGLAWTGRDEGSKQVLADLYGATALTREALERGLNWLARNQRRDGSWSLSGPYSDGVPRNSDNPAAATAMALLAFQGDGNTHQKGTFRQNVIRGWNWLLQQQDGSGDFFHEGGFNAHFYTQGMCTIAICELYGMTEDTKYRYPAEQALRYCLDSQSSEGGWRYTPRSDSDVSVTGWVVMALQSARMAGLDVPEDNLRRVERFLDGVAREGGSRYPYQRSGEIRLSMTAEALLCRQYLGWKRDDPRLVAGVEWITSPENLIDFDNDRDVYTWYYATQVAHHMEGEYWKRWNGVMRQALPEQQVQRGREGGSWDPMRPVVDKWAPHAGRLYVTCLSLCMLEVYWRHLPLYRNVYSSLPRPAAAGGQ